MRLIDADTSFYDIYKEIEKQYQGADVPLKTVYGVPIYIAEKIFSLYVSCIPEVKIKDDN